MNTDREKIRAEVERRLEELNPERGEVGGRPLRAFNPKTFPRERELEKLLAFIDSLPPECPSVLPKGEQPASEDLEEAVESYTEKQFGVNWMEFEHTQDNAFRAMYHFKAGAAWQKQQFEKNRLAACDRQTAEQAEREQDFCMGIIENEHRQPTFSDAIEYGMRLQKEQMMKDAVEGKIYETEIRSRFRAATTGQLSYMKYRNGDKVKLIIIKED